MRSKRLRVAFVLLLVVSALAVLPASSAADDTETVVLPWVPNGDQVGGLGPWYGRVEIQNPSSSNCTIQVGVPAPAGGWSTHSSFIVQPHVLDDLSAADVGLPSPGGAVLITSIGCKAAVAVKQASGNFDEAPWSHGTTAVAGYTGVPSEDAAGQPDWILPIVQTNSGWNSYIRLTNVESSSPTKISVQVFPYQGAGGADGWVFSETILVNAGATHTIDLRQALGQAGFVGFARVTSVGNVVALVQREKTSNGMAMIDVASAYPANQASIQVVGTYALQAPIIFNAYNGWNTGINLANPNNTAATVTISYPGAGRPDDVLTMAPYTSDYVYTPSNAPNQAGFAGNAVIYSNVPVAAAVDEVKYSTGDAISYIAVPAIDSTVSVPLVFKQALSGTHNDNSGINVSNGSDSKTTVQISIYDQSGSLVGGPFNLTIAAHSSDFIYTASTAVPSSTVGSAVVQSLDGTPIVVVSNDVSYDVALDGSAVFNAPSPSGLYRIGGAPTP